MPKVFISHSWNDNQIAFELSRQLRQDKIEVWIDHEQIFGGDSLPDKINQALIWCDTLLLLWSISASESKFVQLEWQNALNLNKCIIPCILDGTIAPPILTRLIYIDFANFEKGYIELQKSLSRNSFVPTDTPSNFGTMKPKTIKDEFNLANLENALQTFVKLNDELTRFQSLKTELFPMAISNTKSSYNQAEPSHLVKWTNLVNQLSINVNLDIQDAEYFYRRGLAAGKENKWEAMVSYFFRSFSISNKFGIYIRNELDKCWVSNFNLGVKKINLKYLRKVDISDAISKFEICIIIDPTRIDAYRNLAVCHIRSNNLSAAKESYLKLLKIDPQNEIVLNEIARLCMQMKDIPCAIEMASRALDLSPDKTEAVVNMALAYDMNGESDKAMAEYQKALAKNPNDSDLMFNMARLYFNSGEFDKAVQMFQKVIFQNPEDYDANINVGNAYLNMAEDVHKKLVEKEKNKVAVTEDELAKLKGLYKEAIPFLEKALGQKGDNGTMWYNLGVAYINVADIEKGKLCIEKSKLLECKLISAHPPKRTFHFLP